MFKYTGTDEGQLEYGSASLLIQNIVITPNMATKLKSVKTSSRQQDSSNPRKNEKCWSKERSSQMSLLLNHMSKVSTKDKTAEHEETESKHQPEDEFMTPDKKLATWLENINRTLCEDSKNGKRIPHPFSKYVADDCVFTTYTGSETLTKKEQYAVIKSDTEKCPGWKTVLHDCKANVNMKAGYADVYMCMSVEGRIPGVVLQCFCVAEWRKREEGWFQTAFTTLRSPPGLTGEIEIALEKKSCELDVYDRRGMPSMSSAWIAALNEVKEKRA